jgi:ribosomal protein S6
MLPASMDEQAVDEFIQKFEAEINQHAASTQSTNKSKQQMVRTSINKGSRNVYLITTYLTASSAIVSELSRFLRLAQGVVLNHLILKEDKAPVAA